MQVFCWLIYYLAHSSINYQTCSRIIQTALVFASINLLLQSANNLYSVNKRYLLGTNYEGCVQIQTIHQTPVVSQYYFIYLVQSKQSLWYSSCIILFIQEMLSPHPS